MAHWFFARWPYLPRPTTAPLTQVLQHPVHRLAYTLAHQFHTTTRHRQDTVLLSWLHGNERSGILELFSFA